jgi:GYF domain 2
MQEEWFYFQGGHRGGPVSFAQLRQLTESSALQATDLVWKEGATDWMAAGSVEGLFPPAAIPIADFPPVPATAAPQTFPGVPTWEFPRPQSEWQRVVELPGAEPALQRQRGSHPRLDAVPARWATAKGARVGPPHLRAHRRSSNLLRSHRPRCVGPPRAAHLGLVAYVHQTEARNASCVLPGVDTLPWFTRRKARL